MQCVIYNATLSDFSSLSAGLQQGIEIGPIGFQVIIMSKSDRICCWKYLDDLTKAENRTHPDSS